MTAYNYNIEDSIGNDSIVGFKINLIRVLYFFKSRLNIGYLKTKVLSHFLKKLNQIYLISEGLKKISFENEITHSMAFYEDINITLNKYRHLYSLLEKSNFFGNSNISEVCDLTLTNFYKIESHIRFHVFDKIDKDSSSDSLNEFSSKLSLGSLQA